MNETTAAILQHALRAEESRVEDLERQLKLAQSGLQTLASNLDESKKTVEELRAILGQSAGKH